VWGISGLSREGYSWLTKARPEDVELTPAERAAALLSASIMAANLQNLDASLDLADRAVGASGDEPSVPLVRALGVRASFRARRSERIGDLELATAVRSDLDRAQQLAEHFSDRSRSYVLMVRGLVELRFGDIRAAREACDAALALDPGDVYSWGVVATAAHLTGDHERALEAATRYLDFALAKGWPSLAVSTAAALVVMAGAGQSARALDLLAEQLDLHGPGEQLAVVEHLMVGYAAVAYLSGDYPRCCRLFAWVRARTFDVGRDLIPVTFAIYRHYVALVAQTLDRDATRRYEEEGRAMSEDEAIACALERP
jgi:tetratricopeptide (TPR) repeat protein